ncbi:MAG: hypothetical protein LBR79_03685 [Oscillospiraceae bacterium]|nr:hypothetical protein [Oscillospiraceae bacterium]
MLFPAANFAGERAVNTAAALKKCLIFFKVSPRRLTWKKSQEFILFKLNHYSCYDLKQSSKVNLSVYFLPAVGWEKVIEIRRFSNGTAIYYPNFENNHI